MLGCRKITLPDGVRALRHGDDLMTQGIGMRPPQRRSATSPLAVAVVVALVFALAIVAAFMIRNATFTAGAVGAANQFWTGLRDKNWSSVYALLPVEGGTFSKDGVTVTIPTQVTLEQFSRRMSTQGLDMVGPDYTARFRILGARKSGDSTVCVIVNYSVAGKQMMETRNIDFSKPNGIGSFAGMRPTRELSNTEEMYFNHVDGKWKLDTGHANGFGFSMYGAGR